MVYRLTAVLALVLPALAFAEPPPVASFTNFPAYSGMKISPSGTHLAFIRQTTEFEAIAVLELKEMKQASQTAFGNLVGIDSFVWANDSRLLIAPTRRFPGYTASKQPTGEILGIDADGKQVELLFGYAAGEEAKGRSLQRRESVYAAADVIDVLPADPDNVIIQTIGYGIEGTFNAAYTMHIRTGRTRKLATSPVRNGEFLTDADHHVALVYGQDAEGNNHVYYRSRESGDWELKANSGIDKGSLWPVARAGKPGSFYVLDDRDAETRGVFIWTPETGEHRLLFRHPVADITRAGVDQAGVAWGFRYVDHFPEYWYPDPEHPLARLHRGLRAQFPDHDVSITSQTDDNRLAVARISGPRTPSVFFVVDIGTGKLMQKLVSRPSLAPTALASVDPIEIVARDGLKIRGYLTVPGGVDARRLPMIVLVHGGPHGVYDGYGFDYEAQLFASRGYAVLQVNFRGSGGRGREFESAGYGKWGLEMQDDITDAVRWAIQDGVADPKRICIAGASYGAYSALTGVYREPEMFRCAVGMAGVYDLPLLFERGDIQTITRGMNYLKFAVGTDTEELKRRSPVYNAEKIRTPVLLLHGKIDERAPFEHAKRMREALEKAGNPPEWFTEWGEGHGFLDEGNRQAAYERLLDFFDRHIGKAAGARPE